MICILELCMRDSSRHEPHLGKTVQADMPIASSQTRCRSLHGPKSEGQPGPKVGFSLPVQPQGWSKPLVELLVGWGVVPGAWLEINVLHSCRFPGRPSNHTLLS